MNFRIGVDGGGTKTAFILTDEAGAILADRRTEGCNPSLIGKDAAHARIRGPLEELRAEAEKIDREGQISHTVLCMAGSRPFWREFGDTLTDCGEVWTFDDSVPVLELATDGRAGLVLHAGTGSFVAARDPQDGVHYAGGLGWRLGDPASAYDLGCHAIGRAILEMQGWAEASAIGEMIRRITGLRTADDVTRHYYTDDMPHITVANLAPEVTALAASGDSVAEGIVAESVRKLAQLANEVIARVIPGDFSDSIPVGLSGAILHTPTAGRAVAETLGVRYVISPITEAPIEGVRRMLTRIQS